MLVFSRKPGESFEIGDNVTVYILGAGKNGNIRVGVEAPKDVMVVRKELTDGTTDGAGSECSGVGSETAGEAELRSVSVGTVSAESLSG